MPSVVWPWTCTAAPRRLSVPVEREAGSRPVTPSPAGAGVGRRPVGAALAEPLAAAAGGTVPPARALHPGWSGPMSVKPTTPATATIVRPAATGRVRSGRVREEAEDQQEPDEDEAARRTAPSPQGVRVSLPVAIPWTSAMTNATKARTWNRRHHA